MSFGDYFKHMSPLYDAATGFTGTAAQNAMMVLGGKAMGGMGVNSGMSSGGQQISPQQLMQMTGSGQSGESQEDKRRRMLIEAIMRGQ